MEVNRLLSDELTYELQIRGCEIPSTVADKRSLLRQVLSSEQRDSVVAEIPNFDIDSEFKICQVKLDELLGGIQEFDNSNADNEYKRIKSRLLHILGRINRITVDSNAHEKKKKHLSEFCQELFGALDDANNIARWNKPGTNSLLEVNRNPQVSLIDLDDGVSPAPDVHQNNSPQREEPIPLAEATHLRHLATRMNDLSLMHDRETQPTYHFGPKEFLSRWKISFDGSSSVIAFIEDAEEMARSRGVSKDRLFQSASELFKGDALLWYRAKRNTFSGWDALVLSLKASFLPPDYELSLMEDIRKRTQGQDEGVLFYIIKMQSLFNKLSRKLPEQEQVDIIRRNLLPHLHTAMALHEIHSIDELISVGRRIEDSHWRAKQYCPPPQNLRLLQEPELAYRRNSKYMVRGTSAVTTSPSSLTNPSPSSSLTNPSPAPLPQADIQGNSGPICWNCRQRGHFRTQCPRPKKFYCTGCGAKGVTVQNCSSCSGNGQVSH